MSEFGQQRDKLLAEIKKRPPGEKALNLLKKLRLEYDSAISDYSNVLHLLSDNAYRDRRHFLLELIQNADDAFYSDDKPELHFYINKDSIELKYNENGFSTDDVVAITGAGVSTKKERDKHGFIGEKGIGFKSVFALAAKVEIISPPWSFYLTKDEPIIPYPFSHTNPIKKGTYLRIFFIDNSSIDIIAEEINGFVSGKIESFLFLQKIASITVVDNRTIPSLKKGLKIDPPDRSSNIVCIETLPRQEVREYTIYEEEAVFSADLVAERWEQLGLSKAIKRKMLIAALAYKTDQHHTPGRLFCYLPTNVILPIPVYLQVDGHTTANRQELHDPQLNKWNRYLCSVLPDFFCNAILHWRYENSIAAQLVDFIPIDNGNSQLSHVLSKVIDKLHSLPWVKTCYGGELGWQSPEKVVIASKFWHDLFRQVPNAQHQAEQTLGKYFMAPSWSGNKKWEKVWKHYNIENLSEDDTLKILNALQLPTNYLQTDQNFINLYRELLNLPTMKKDMTFEHQFKRSLLSLSIFPLEGDRFGPLYGNEDDKYYWISTQSKRATGIKEDMHLNIVNPEYTYISGPSSGSSEQVKVKVEQRNMRNTTVKNLLRKLDIKELNEKTLLNEIQIPWLKREDLELKTTHRLDILFAIFETYRAKINPEDEYLEILKKLKKARLLSESKQLLCIEDMILPSWLDCNQENSIFRECPSIEVLYLPEQYFISAVSSDNRKPKQEKLAAIREDLCRFMQVCGIRTKPGFINIKEKYSNYNEAYESNRSLCEVWDNAVRGDITKNNHVVFKLAKLDAVTKNILENNKPEQAAISKALYDAWLHNFSDALVHMEKEFFLHNRHIKNPPVGFLLVEYKRVSDRVILCNTPDWGGVKREIIPLITANEECKKAGGIYKLRSGSVSDYEMTTRLIPIVFEADNHNITTPGFYHTKYLASLHVQELKLKDVNKLWSTEDDQLNSHIIKIIIELLKNDYQPEDLKIYDSEEKRLRHYSDFRLGKKKISNRPLIELQYGKDGFMLGKLLKLETDSEISLYNIQFFTKIFQQNYQPNHSLYREKIETLLRSWHTWSREDQDFVKSAYEKALTNLKEERGLVLVFNNNKLYNQFIEAGLISFHISTNIEVMIMQEAASGIGFKKEEDLGRMKLIEPNALTGEEKISFQQYLKAYMDILEHNELIKLKSKLARFGHSDTIADQIIKASGAAQVIMTDTISIETTLTLPYWEKDSGQFIASCSISLEHILAQLLYYCDFTREKDALNELSAITANINARKKRETIQVQTVNTQDAPQGKPKAKPSPNSDEAAEQETETAVDITENNREFSQQGVHDVLEGIRESMSNLTETESSDDIITDDWKTGIMPEEAGEIRTLVGNSFVEALNKGPEIYAAKVKTPSKPKLKVIDTEASTPKTFLENEYQGRCQLCDIRLKLQNGRNFFLVFRIAETKDSQRWWVDRPFNILCLCPNCHALAKYGGGLDLTSIEKEAQALIDGTTFAVEVTDSHGDYHIVTVKVNGSMLDLNISANHLNYFAALLEKTAVADDENVEQ